jgi:putative endonuclease
MTPRIYYVYIMANFNRSVLYIGITNNLHLRVLQHKNGEGSIFTSKYKCYYLVHFEEYFQVNAAISREKELKNWQRKWKDELIKKENRNLKDLADDWFN